MTKAEWSIVMLAFTDLFDIANRTSPKDIHIDKTFAAGTILIEELKRIRRNESVRQALKMGFSLNGTGGMVSGGGINWKKRNEELEKKKEMQRAQELGDLTQVLKASIEKVKKDQQGE
jgi:hypothetical protein